LFLQSIETSKPIKGKDEEEEDEIESSIRVDQICEELMKTVYNYIMRGLFERDKLTFKVIICLK